MDIIPEEKDAKKNVDPAEALKMMKKAEQDFLERRQSRMNGTTPDPEKLKKEIEYWNRVHSTSKSKGTIMPAVIPLNEMPYDEAKARLNGIFLVRQQQIRISQGRPDFKIEFDETQKAVLHQMLLYFINDPACKYDLHKGLYVWGDFGTFKTETMLCFSQFTQNAGLYKAFEFTVMSEIYQRYPDEPQTDFVQDASQHFRCFDEVGRITGQVMKMGNPIDLNETIFERRYKKFQFSGQITHMISNASPNDISKMVTPALADRIRSMIQGIHFKGHSKR